MASLFSAIFNHSIFSLLQFVAINKAVSIVFMLTLTSMKTCVETAVVNVEDIAEVKPQTILTLIDTNDDGIKPQDDNILYHDDDTIKKNTHRQSKSKNGRNQRRRMPSDRKHGNRRSRNRQSKNRNHKIRESLGLRRRSCPATTSYVFKTEAEDIFGNIVEVHPVIHVGSLTISQYFYESYCHEEECMCRGAESTRFESSCETTHSYTYARVVKNGEAGWTYIKVRSGCSCVIREKSVSRSNLLEML